MGNRVDRMALITALRQAGILARTEIVEEPHGFRLRARGLNREQIRTVRQSLARISALYGNVSVGNGALLPATEQPWQP